MRKIITHLRLNSIYFSFSWPWAHPGIRKRIYWKLFWHIFQMALQSWDHGWHQDGNLLVTVGGTNMGLPIHRTQLRTLLPVVDVPLME